MITIRYCEKGIAVSDFDIETWWGRVVREERKGINNLWRVSTTLPITRARVAVCEGDLLPTDIAFEYQEQCQHPDRDGRLAHWPEGFCDITDKLLERLL